MFSVITTYAVWILIMMLIFWIIVFFHELWHFMSAKFFWIKVNEFGLWLPPKLFNLFEDKSWTAYSVNLLPLWWFVSLKWEQFNEVNIYDDDSLVGAAFYKQVIIILAWVMMNFIIAGIIFSFLFFVWVQPMWINTEFPTTTKTKLIPTLKEAVDSWLVKVNWLSLSPMYDSVAMKAWIKDKDILIEINWKKIIEPQEMVNAVKYFQPPIEFTVLRKWVKKHIKITPVDWKIWCYIWYNFMERNESFVYKYHMKYAVIEGFGEVYNQTKLLLEIFSIVFKKMVMPVNENERKEALDVFGWPISLWAVFVDLASHKATVMIYITMAAMLSINLAIFNILPLPALDWWRFFIMIINWFVIMLFWKKMIDDKTESLIHVFGYILLIVLSFVIAYSDIVKLLHK